MFNDSKMDDAREHVCDSSVWESTIVCYIRMMNKVEPKTYLKGVVENEKKLTVEAICMISVILCFALLVVVGSCISLYELFKKKGKGKKAEDATRDVKSGKQESQGNFEELKPTIESWITPVAANHIVTVDTFFVISGFLKAYLFFQEYEKLNGKVSWPYFYIKRFVRLTPVYMAVLGIYTFILPYMGSGPLWPRYCTHPACEKNGWYNLFYINNFVIAEKQCMLWCWYLAVEIQFYIISPLFMVLLQRSSRFGYSLIGVVTFASCLANFVITNQKNLLDGPVRFFQHLKEPLYQDRFFRYFNLVYQKPYTRIPPYLIGIGLGYYFYTRRENKDRKNSLMFLCFGWFVTALMMGFCYLGLYNRDESAIESAVYNGLKHLFFPCGLAWIIFLCITGQGGLINRFLSCRAFLPLARLSYCAYLIHFLFLLRYFRSLTEMQDHSELLFLSIYTRTLLYTYATSFFASLLFEIPVLNLLDVYKKKRRPRT